MTEVTDKQTLLRELQLVENEILLAVVDVCEKNNIEYFLSSGTLLGAVRHGGFIPWDDDIDIEMPIQDYRRFLEIAQLSLGERYFVQTFMTDPNWNFAYTRIRKNNTTCMDSYYSACRIHHGVWIDVFPVVSLNPGISLTITKKLISVSNFFQIQNRVDCHKEEYEEEYGKLWIWLVNAFSKLPMRTRQRIHTALLNLVFNARPEKCTHMANVWGNITTVFPKEVYLGEPQRITFEGNLLKAPHDYIRYLEIKYGDYLTPPPPEERHGHGGDVIVDLENSYENYIT